MGCSGKLEAEGGGGRGGQGQIGDNGKWPQPPRSEQGPCLPRHYLRRQEKSPDTRERSAGLRFSLAFHCLGQSWGASAAGQWGWHGTLPPRHGTLPTTVPGDSTAPCPSSTQGCQGLLPHGTQGQHASCTHSTVLCPHGSSLRRVLTWSCSYSRTAA